MSRGGDVGDKPVTEPAEFVGGGKNLAIEGNGGGRGVPGGSLWTGVRQWISSVLGMEKSIFLAWAIARMVPKAAWRKRELVRYEEEEVVRAKSSTYERTKLWGREICKEET